MKIKGTAMPATKKRTLKNRPSKKIAVTFSGSGVQAVAYFVDDSFMKKWGIDKPDVNGHYTTSFDQQDLSSDTSVDSVFICHGLQDDAEFEVTFDGKVLPIEGMQMQDEFDPEVDDEESNLKINYIKFNRQKYLVPSGKHLLIETTEYDNGSLIAEIDVEEQSVEISEMLIEVRDLDTDNDVSEATYMAGLIGSAEYDILEFHYKNQVAEFELSFHGLCSEGLYLVKKDSSGTWSECHKIHNSSEI